MGFLENWFAGKHEYKLPDERHPLSAKELNEAAELEARKDAWKLQADLIARKDEILAEYNDHLAAKVKAFSAKIQRFGVMLNIAAVYADGPAYRAIKADTLEGLALGRPPSIETFYLVLDAQVTGVDDKYNKIYSYTPRYKTRFYYHWGSGDILLNTFKHVDADEPDWILFAKEKVSVPHGLGPKVYQAILEAIRDETRIVEVSGKEN